MHYAAHDAHFVTRAPHAVIHSCHRSAARDFGQNLFGGAEAEIVEKDRHLLPVGGDILGPPHYQGRGEEFHFLHGDVRVHPVGAGGGGEVEGPPFARCQCWLRRIRHAILRIRWDLPVPVQDGFGVKVVCEVDAEALCRV
jgi:hypothetical protein